MRFLVKSKIGLGAVGFLAALALGETLVAAVGWGCVLASAGYDSPHFLKMLLGWACYHYWVTIQGSAWPDTKFGAFVISWAGYYGYSDSWFRENEV